MPTRYQFLPPRKRHEKPAALAHCEMKTGVLMLCATLLLGGVGRAADADPLAADERARMTAQWREQIVESDAAVAREWDEAAIP